MNTFQPIKLTGIIAEEVGVPRNDGSDGSALYEVPLRLSSRPPQEWAEIFLVLWDRPPRWTTMHRPGIASVIGDKIILDGTTIEELRAYHRETLLLCVTEANKKYVEHLQQQHTAAKQEADVVRRHKAHVSKAAQGIRFP